METTKHVDGHFYLKSDTVKLSNIWFRRTVPYRTELFLIVYNFVYKHSAYFLVVDNYRLQYLLQNYIT